MINHGNCVWNITLLSLNSNSSGLKYWPVGAKGAHESIFPSDNWSWYKKSSTKRFCVMHHKSRILNADQFHCSNINEFLSLHFHINHKPTKEIVPASAIEFNSQFIWMGIHSFKTLDLLKLTGSPSIHPYVNQSSQPNEHIMNIPAYKDGTHFGILSL